ncbi:uncharacterized protein ASCRUDRAFT_6084 [Ascoidea rubescens DSM 1968]|uniref:Uncharacterized protein n=1 Tax=Ascoidea rubescens DSM 1968 TaxID=1344418 RepID=A0A1D2VRI6_9ASCO|nr:hypothetical protein ASCRUDRAFT_6084 [Ascoidea rubescens DSM 1968]ODV64226.1 hypothetical protein ASCRUDRAFT_6084 [Ascoidea rubescens DSM 1968]
MPNANTSSGTVNNEIKYNHKLYHNFQWLKQIRGLPSLDTYELINQVKQTFITKYFRQSQSNNSSLHLKTDLQSTPIPIQMSKTENIHEKHLDTMITFTTTLKSNLKETADILNQELNKDIENLKWLEEIVS